MGKEAMCVSEGAAAGEEGEGRGSKSPKESDREIGGIRMTSGGKGEPERHFEQNERKEQEHRGLGVEL